MELTTIFGKNLRAKRMEKGLKQKELAQMTGIAPQTLSGYEGRGILPPLENAAKLAQALGVSLDWLTGLAAEEKTGSGKQMKTKGDAARDIVALLSVAEVSLSYVEFQPIYGDEQHRVFGKAERVPGIVFNGSMKEFAEALIKFQELQGRDLLPPGLAATAIDGLCQKLDSEAASDYEESLPF